jgi:hypothetical protein
VEHIPLPSPQIHIIETAQWDGIVWFHYFFCNRSFGSNFNKFGKGFISWRKRADGFELVVFGVQNQQEPRYVGSCEAAWRLFSFSMNKNWPNVERLSIHLPKIILNGKTLLLVSTLYRSAEYLL